MTKFDAFNNVLRHFLSDRLQALMLKNYVFVTVLGQCVATVSTCKSPLPFEKMKKRPFLIEMALLLMKTGVEL